MEGVRVFWRLVVGFRVWGSLAKAIPRNSEEGRVSYESCGTSRVLSKMLFMRRICQQGITVQDSRFRTWGLEFSIPTTEKPQTERARESR